MACVDLRIILGVADCACKCDCSNLFFVSEMLRIFYDFSEKIFIAPKDRFNFDKS